MQPTPPIDFVVRTGDDVPYVCGAVADAGRVLSIARACPLDPNEATVGLAMWLGRRGR